MLMIFIYEWQNKYYEKLLQNMHLNVVEVTKTNYTLENGDVYEHTFDIDEDITVKKFQKLLDNTKNTIIEALNKIDKDEI